MNKQRLKNLGIFICALVTAIVLISVFEWGLDQKIDEIYDVAAYTKALNLQYEDPTKDKGEVILKKSMANGNLMLLGSSELSSPVDQNPVNMFPNTTLPDNLTIVGQAYVQSLLHAMKVGTEAFEGQKKLGIVVSLQWFFGEDIDPSGFAANFSELQFYQMMSNERLSKESKLYVCKRTDELLKEIQGYDDIKVYAWLYRQDHVLGQAGLTVLKPYYILREKVLTIKDKWNTYQLLKKTKPDASKPETLDLNWEEAYAQAHKTGEENCTNNEFYVEDGYYSNYLAEVITDLKDESANVSLGSKEMEDFEMFLQICKENDVEPYVIMMNTNGKYYDYIGIDQARRNALYDEVESRTTENGFTCLRLSDKEYEPYFMVDVMHLGWRGWLYVEEQMSKYFAEIAAK